MASAQAPRKPQILQAYISAWWTKGLSDDVATAWEQAQAEDKAASQARAQCLAEASTKDVEPHSNDLKPFAKRTWLVVQRQVAKVHWDRETPEVQAYVAKMVEEVHDKNI